MKIMGKRVLIIFAILSIFSVTLFASTEKTDIPQGILPENWRFLGEDIGLALNFENPRNLKGEIWVKISGRWHPINIEQKPRVVPLN